MPITRENMQPSINNIVHVITKFGQEFDVRYLLGDHEYEGWYIPSLRRIMPQKELQVTSFMNSRGVMVEYFPREELDFIFSRSKVMDAGEFSYEKTRYDLGIRD